MRSNVSILVYLILLLLSSFVVKRTLKRLHMKKALVLFRILCGIFYVLVPLILGSSYISERIGSIYYTDSVLETFLLLEIEWLSVPLIVFKSFSIGSFVIALIAIGFMVLVLSSAISIAKDICDNCFSHKDSSYFSYSLRHFFNYFICNRRVYLRLRHLLN